MSQIEHVAGTAFVVAEFRAEETANPHHCTRTTSLNCS